jgi:Cu/Ag efflux protein CusF
MDLRPGQKVKVGYQEAQGVLAADRVEQIPLRSAGMVKVIDPNAHKLVLHTSWDRDRAFSLAEGCAVVLRDRPNGVLSDIKPGDHVTVIYEAPSGSDMAREVAQTSASFTGSLTAIDLRARTVSAKDMFGVKRFDLTKDCAIVVGGRTDAPLMDLQPGERLTFNYDEVNGVNVANRIAPAQNTRDTATAEVNP